MLGPRDRDLQELIETLPRISLLATVVWKKARAEVCASSRLPGARRAVRPKYANGWATGCVSVETRKTFLTVSPDQTEPMTPKPR